MKLLGIISLLLLWQFSALSQQQPAVAALQEPAATRMVRLYPNPAVSYITFELRDEFKRGLNLQVYSGILGKKVFVTSLLQDRFQLNLNEFPRGIYIYHLTDANGKIVESGKFQVIK
ncbi:MAG: T9SS type A sorting domain-containing protein [Sphingomonadales bacterium]